jgi:hypothetical protein
METRNSTNQITCEVGNKNQLEKQYMPSEAFHRTTDGRVREITARVQFEPLNLESFDPVTHPPARIQTQTKYLYCLSNISSNIWWATASRPELPPGRRAAHVTLSHENNLSRLPEGISSGRRITGEQIHRHEEANTWADS